MMGHGYRYSAMLSSKLLEPTVAKLSSGHFDRDAFLFGILGSVQIGFVEGYAKVSANLIGKGGVTVGFLPTEVKIDVGADAGEVEPMQDIDERDRVGASTQGDDDLGSFWQ